MSKIHGFTMLEMVVVILVLSIISVTVIYNWPGTTINIDAQAREFANDIRFTQSLAMSRDERYRIIEASSTTYQILNSSGSTVPLPNGLATATLNSGLSFGAWSNLTNHLIAFDGRGTPYLDAATPGTPLAVGTTYSITIIGGGNTKTITIAPLTGRVSVQ